MNTRIPEPPAPPVDSACSENEGDDDVKLPPLPFVTIDDKVRLQRLPFLLEETFAIATPPDTGVSELPILAYFVGTGLPQKLMPLLPVEPERLFVLAATGEAHTAVMTALAKVEVQEPNFGSRNLGYLGIGNHSKFKEVFQQMAKVPMTVLSISFAPTGGTFFFLRTRFTIDCFFREIAPILANPTAQHLGQN